MRLLFFAFAARNFVYLTKNQNYMRRLIFLLLLLLSLKGLSQSVYKTPSGQKYHLASCHMVKNVSEKITIEKARQLGLQPCKICKPPEVLSGPSPDKQQGQHTTVQCRGTTKAGTRCKHMTRIANGYCYQHQP